MIRLSWDDAGQRLTIHERQGSYPGMPTSREFQIVMGNTSYNPLVSEDTAARTVIYEGLEVSIGL